MTHLTVLNSAKERKWADSQKCSTALQNEQREEVSTRARTALFVHVCVYMYSCIHVYGFFLLRERRHFLCRVLNNHL